MTRNRIPEYEYTNESLESIVAGLDVQPHDVILAVCGSGDQSFALLENAGMVVSVDTSKVQLDYAKRRAELLKEDRFDEFLTVRGLSPVYYYYDKFKQRNSYFEQDGRLSRIAARLDNLQFLQGNIFTVGGSRQKIFPKDYFSKVYLSNAVGYIVTDPKFYTKKYYRHLKVLYERLPQDGLIYLSRHFYSNKLHVDESLTSIAREREIKTEQAWTPIVFRKL